MLFTSYFVIYVIILMIIKKLIVNYLTFFDLCITEKLLNKNTIFNTLKIKLSIPKFFYFIL